MKALIESIAQNKVLANLLMLFILLSGVAAATLMIREDFPSFTLDTVSVSLGWDGASPQDTEEGVSLKVEEAIDGIQGIETFTTTSSEGNSTTTITVKYGYDASSVYEKVKNKIDQISTFPSTADNPVVTLPTITKPVLTLGLSGSMDERELKELAKTVRDELKALPSISQAEMTGTRDYQITVTVSEETLQKYGFTLADVTTAIQNSSLNRSGGTIKTQGETFSLRTKGKRYSGKELEKIVILAKTTGETLTLGQLATVTDGFKEDRLRIESDGSSAAFVTVSKTDKEDAIAIANAVQAYIAEKNESLPSQSQLTILVDNTQEIRGAITMLAQNGIMGLLLVFAMLWLFLDTRLAFWAGMGIPISLAGGLAILWMLGYTINTVSLFGLIMVLGIVADDAIVVGEAIYVHRKKGAGPISATVLGIREVGLPVMAAVATTVVAFIPLMNINGILGKIVIGLSVAVVACLAISLVECLVLLPAHLSDLPDPNRKKVSRFALVRAIDAFHTRSVASMETVAKSFYQPLLKKVVKNRYLALCVAVTIALVTTGLFQGGLLKYVMFPELDSTEVVASVTFPEGTPYKTTQQAVKKIEAGLLSLAEKTKTVSGEPLIKHRVTVFGQSTSNHLGHLGSTGAHAGGVQVSLLDSSKRGIHAQQICRAWENEVGPIAGVQKLTFSSGAGGPDGGAIGIALQGGTLKALEGASKEIRNRLQKIDGVFRIRDDSSPGKNEITFTLKPEARTLGITVQDLSDQLFAAYYGKEAVKIQRGEDEVDVMVTYTENERRTLESLQQMRIKTTSGALVPLVEVANFITTPGYAKITRTDKKRELTVSADVNTEKVVAGDVLQELSNGFLSEVQSKWGVGVQLKGDAEKDKKAFGSMAIWVPLAILTIYMIVAAMFHSYLQPVIILITIPFGLIGAFLGHFLMGINLCMFSVFGMVALTGVVVNDAIVLIDRINTNLKEGIPFEKAVIQGGTRRFRAVMLTSITTIGGLLPLIMESDPAAQSMVPMGVSLAAGIAFATLLTLLLIPALLMIINDARCGLSFLRHNSWPVREAVEPAFLKNQNRLKELQAHGDTFHE